MKNNTIDFQPKKLKSIVLGVVVALAVIIVVASSVVIVPAGSTGVVVTLGKVSDTPLTEGFHLKAPFVQTVETVSNKIQKQEVDAPAVSKDLQAIESMIAVNFRIASNSSPYIYKNIGPDYHNIVLLPAVQESMKSVTARYTAEDLITKRAQVSTEVKESLEEKMTEYGIIIEKFNIVNFDFSEEFNNAIEAKQVAEQNLIKTETEQQQAIVIAEAEAKKQVIAAEAEAEAILKKAEAQAEANETIAKSLSGELTDYLTVDKWDGKLPQVTGNGGTIIDIGDLDKTE